MTGIEKIVGRIEGDAQAEIDATMAKARAEADEIKARYDAQAAKEFNDILTRGKKAAAEREERLASSAQMEANKLTLSAKQDMLDAAFELALKQLCELGPKDYVELLAKLAVRASTTGREQLILSQKDRKPYGVKVAQRANKLLADAGKTGELTLSSQSGSFQGGLLLSDGDVEVNCTFETLVRLTRSEMAGKVAKVLFD